MSRLYRTVPTGLTRALANMSYRYVIATAMEDVDESGATQQQRLSEYSFFIYRSSFKSIVFPPLLTLSPIARVCYEVITSSASFGATCQVFISSRTFFS